MFSIFSKFLNETRKYFVSELGGGLPHRGEQAGLVFNKLETQ